MTPDPSASNRHTNNLAPAFFTILDPAFDDLLAAAGDKRVGYRWPMSSITSPRALAGRNSSKVRNKLTAPMVPKHIYRLKDYRICQLPNGRLWWEGHSEFGSQISGPCYLWGDILLVGERRNEEIGFLKSEFLDSLRKLPGWRQTRYYCFASALIDVRTGRVANEDRFVQKIPLQGNSVTYAESIHSREFRSFRLGRYQITVAPDDRLTWKCSGGAGRIIVGQAEIESGILFLGPGHISGERATKKEYLSALCKLPEWGQTILWCRSLALKTVFKEGKPTHPLSFRENRKVLQREIPSTGGRHWDGSKWLWSRMVHFHRGCLENVWAMWLQKGLAELIRKVRKKR